MASKADIKKKTAELANAIGYSQKLASELKAMTEVSTPVLNRNTSAVRMKVRALASQKFGQKKRHC